MSAPLAADPSFDYNSNPVKGAWTKKFVQRALGSQNAGLIDELFAAASTIASARNLFNDAYQTVAHPHFQKGQDRDAAGQELFNQFGPRVQIAGHPHFAARMCRGIIAYRSGSGRIVDLSAPLNLHSQPNPSAAVSSSIVSPSQPVPSSSTPSQSVQSQVPVTLVLPSSAPPPSSAHGSITPVVPSVHSSSPTTTCGNFILQCQPPRFTKQTPVCRLRVSQIWVDHPADKIHSGDLTVRPLIDKLRNRNILSDSENQFLSYVSKGQMVTISEDEDIQTAVWEAQQAGLVELCVKVTSTDDIFFSSTAGVKDDTSPAHNIAPSLSQYSMAMTIRSKSKVSERTDSKRRSSYSRSLNDHVSADESSPTKRRKQLINSTEMQVMDVDILQDIQPVDTNEKEDEPDNQIDIEDRFRDTMNSQVCEHMSDGSWENAAKLVGIEAESSKSTSTWQLPGMLKPLYHWQWVVVFVVANMNSGHNDLHGALLADEMGLGKTIEAIALSVFRLQLFRRWQNILADWKRTSSTRMHCASDAISGSQCPSRGTSNEWFAICPCEPDSPLHHNRPIEGPSFFLVPTNNIDDWRKTFIAFVDLNGLGVEFVVLHGTNVSMRSELRDLIRTTTEVPKPSRTKPMEPGVHYGVPKSGSSAVWLLSTWQTWDRFYKKTYLKKRTYSFTASKKRKTVEEEYGDLHAALWVIDEAHNTKNEGKGPWKTPALMKRQLPDYRGYTLALSGTMISADPTDLLAAIHVIGSDSWTQSSHPLHDMRLEGLKQMKRAIVRYRDAPSDASKEELKKSADEAVKTFRLRLPDMLIRRHDGSRWGRSGDRLLKLSALHVKAVGLSFPAQHVAAYESMIKEWRAQNLALLEKAQMTWDANQHDGRYLSEHPKRPDALRADSVLKQSRMLRLCANLPYLAVLVPAVASQEHHWTNENAQLAFEDKATGRMRRGSLLDQHYCALVDDSPKVLGIARILMSHQHRRSAALIMSSFPEFLLVLERFLRESAGRRTRMYYGSSDRRTAAINAFMLRKGDNGELLDDDQPDTLLGLANTMGTGTNLQRATVVILCEPIYDPKLMSQVPKRAHRQGNSDEVWFYRVTSKTMIENMVEQKQAAKAGFTAEAFQLTASEALKQGPSIDVGTNGPRDEVAQGTVVAGSSASAAIDLEATNVEMDEL